MITLRDFVINPELVKLLDSQDILDVLKDSVEYQMQKLHDIQKTSEGRDWYSELPQIVKGKIDSYNEDYEKLAGILKQDLDGIKAEMNKGYYFWRLMRSACKTYQNDLIEYDHQLNQEFNLKETEAISDNSVLAECIRVLDQHAIENHE